jgi:hydrogenase 3 maturation protease
VAEEARGLVVLGVGNRLRGDDAIGCLVCDELLKLAAPVPCLSIFDCGAAPENYIRPVADRNPERILVVDCCDFGGEPGAFRRFCRDDIEQLSYGLLSTHTLPLTLTVEMLALETGAEIELLGVQPQQMEFGTDLSPAVRAALPALVQFVRDRARD